MKKIRALAVSDDELARADIAEVARVFDQVCASPDYSRRLRGGIIFAFGKYARDPRPNFEIDAVRGYIRQIDRRYPHFAYFLPEDAEHGQVFAWIASLATPVEPEPGKTEGITVDPRELTALVVARIRAVEAFCAAIADDPAPTVNAILEAMPDEIAAAVRTEVR